MHLLLLFLLAVPALAYEPRSGDLIFQSSRSEQASAIEAVTGSRFSHCGLVERDGKDVFVWEAVGPVRRVPFDDFVEGGRWGQYAAYRCVDELNTHQIEKIVATARTLKGRPYDPKFGPGDDRIYCSELVWKAFEAAGIEICPLRPMASYPIARRPREIRERWGPHPPLETLMVAPKDLADSPRLRCVKEMD